MNTIHEAAPLTCRLTVVCIWLALATAPSTRAQTPDAGANDGARYLQTVRELGFYSESLAHQPGSVFIPGNKSKDGWLAKLIAEHKQWRDKGWRNEANTSATMSITELAMRLGENELLCASTKHFFVVTDREPVELRPAELATLTDEIAAINERLPGAIRIKGNRIETIDWLLIDLFRCEDLRSRFLDYLGLKQAPPMLERRRTECFMLSGQGKYELFGEKHGRASRVYLGPERFGVPGNLAETDGVKQFPNARLSTDTYLHTVLAHRVGAAMLSLYLYMSGEEASKFTDSPPKWLEMGIAHSLEMEVGGHAVFFTENAEVDGAVDTGTDTSKWNPKDWHREMGILVGRKAARKNSRSGSRRRNRQSRGSDAAAPTLAELTRLDAGGSNIAEKHHIASWSLFTFLRLQPDGGADKLRQFLDQLRAGQDSEAAMMAVYKCSETAITEQWHDWVRANRRGVRVPAKPLGIEDDVTLVETFDRVMKDDKPRGARARSDRRSVIGALRWSAGKPAFDRLLKVLDGGNPKESHQALVTLRAKRDEPTAKLLIKELNKVGKARRVGEEYKRLLVLAAGAFGEWKRAMTDALRKMGSGTASTSFRAAICRSLGELGDSRASEFVLQESRDAIDHVVRAEAASALAKLSQVDAFDRAKALLDDKSWHVRIASIQVFRSLGDKRCIPLLIEQLAKERGRLQEDIIDVLGPMSGLREGQYPLKAEQWRLWWDSEKDRILSGHGPASAGAATVGAATNLTDFGKIYSKKFMFLVDVSMSMNVEIEMAADATASGDRRRSKLDFVIKTLQQVIKHEIEDDVTFDIVLFANKAWRWKDRLVPATAENRALACHFLSEHTEGITAMTNLEGAVEIVLSDADKAFDSGQFESAMDTIYLVTDGSPTTGEVDSRLLLGMFSERNRNHRIRVNVITIGALDTDLGFLDAMAEDNAGYCRVLFRNSR